MTARNWFVFAGMIGVLFAMIVAYGITYDPKSPTSKQELVTVANGDTLRATAKALAGAFAKDRSRANRVFKNRLCVITGQIVRVDQNFLGEPVVKLASGGKKQFAVSLIFQKTEQGYVDLLEIDETISVLGICVGHEPRYGIRLRQCMLVSRAETKGDWDMREK